jgi:hypothetical protein
MRDRRGACLATALASLMLAQPAATAWAATCTTVFAPAATTGCGGPPQAVALGDLDRDGRLDVVTALGSANAFAVQRTLAGGALAAAVTRTTGATTRAVAVADLDEDGAPDVVVAAGNEVQVWRGDGAGGLTRGATLAVPGTPRALVVHDLDADGDLDLAAASASANSVQVLLQIGGTGTAGGSFAPPAAHAVGTNPVALVLAEVTGDAIPDLVTADNSGAGISVLRALTVDGVPTGGFATPVRTTTATSPYGLAAGDLDRDGRTDLVVSHGGGTTVTVLRGVGGSAFTARSVTTPSLPRELALADLDGDGIADLVVACTGANQVAVLPGTAVAGVPDGGFGGARTFAVGSSPTPLACADTDGDGRADVVAGNTAHSTLSRLPGACSSQAATTLALLRPVGGEPWWPGQPQEVHWSKGAGVQAVDLEWSQDGGTRWEPLATNLWGTRATVIAPGPVTAAARVRVRDRVVRSRSATSPADFDVCGLLGGPRDSPLGLPGAVASALADRDGDGDLDLALLAPDALRVLDGDGTGTFVARAGIAADSARALALTDLDGDGRPEVVTLGRSTLRVDRWGDGALDLRTVLPLAITGEGLALLPGDAHGGPGCAVVGRGADGGRLQVIRATGGALSLAGDHVLAAPGRRVLATDLDGDGRTDLVVGTEQGIESWRGDADGGFTRAAVRDLPAAPGDLAFGDFDGDGALDLLAALTATGDVWRLRGLAGLAFAAPTAHTAGPTPAHLTVTDWEGDGRADVALARATPDGLALLLGAVAADPGGTFAPPEGFATPTVSPALAIADVDGDRSPDAVLAGTDGTLRVLPAQCGPQRSDTLAWTAAPTASVAPGDAVPLRWVRGEAVAQVTLELSRDDGATWQPLLAVSATGEWTWRVSGPGAAQARLRVRDPQVPARQSVSAAFAITGPALSAPAPGPAGVALSAAWPSPARGTVRWTLSLPSAGEAQVEVLDLQGRVTRVLHAGPLPAGTHTLQWDGRDAQGRAVAAGVWFARARVGPVVRVQRVVRLP